MSNTKPTPMEVTLNLTPAKPPNYLQTLEEDINNDSAVKDFEQARSNIVNIISIGTTAIGELSDLAHASQAPGHYEILSKLMKDLSDTSEKLLKTHEMLEKITNKKANKNKKLGETDGKVLVLSTNEVAAALRELEEKKK